MRALSVGDLNRKVHKQYDMERLLTTLTNAAVDDDLLDLDILHGVGHDCVPRECDGSENNRCK